MSAVQHQSHTSMCVGKDLIILNKQAKSQKAAAFTVIRAVEVTAYLLHSVIVEAKRYKMKTIKSRV